MPEIVIGLVGAYIGWSLCNTAIEVAKKQVEQNRKTKLIIVFAILYGLGLLAIGGAIIGVGLVDI